MKYIMGLDMYANRRYFISNYEKNPLTKILGKKTIEKLLEANFVTITKESMYWRKANHIHRFFVEQVQNDTDDCGEYYVPENTLRILKNKLKAVLKAYEKDKEEWIDVAEIELPTTEGFFFGGTDYIDEYDEPGKDPYYITQCKATLEWVDEVLKDPENGDIYYTSSW